MGTAAPSARVVAAWGRPWQELAHPPARGDAGGPSAPQSFRSAALSSRRELMPGLVNTLRRCHSTERTDRNSWAVISALVWPSAASRTLTAPLAAAPPCHDQEPRARGRAGRGNLIAAGSTNTPSSASLPGDRSDERRVQLRGRSAHDRHRDDRRHHRHRQDPAAQSLDISNSEGYGRMRGRTWCWRRGRRGCLSTAPDLFRSCA
jgi:hypothetical protein